MSDHKIADFDRFRFFRDSDENIVSFDAQAFGEQMFPVLDCEFLRLARLHVHDQAARKQDWLEAFETEMDLLSDIDERLVSRPFTWGRDDDELFYVNCFLDGEELTDYLRREGALSPVLAARWLMPFVNLVVAEKECPMSIQRFSNRNLQVVRNLETDKVELHFTEFTAWTKPGNLVVERGPEYFLAQSFLSLVSGIPIRDFTAETLPRQFDELSSDCQKAIRATFDGKPGDGSEDFFAEMQRLALSDAALVDPPLPRSLLRQWIRSEISTFDEKDLPILAEQAETDPQRCYSMETEVDDFQGMTQFIPGYASIPREGWLEQHWLAIRRRGGRNFANQLEVYKVDEYPSITLVTEEYTNGISLRELLRETGPLDLEYTAAMVNRLSSAMDGLEASASASPVWWLPDQNIFINLGTRDPADFVFALQEEGPEFWERIPFRLRLHQTMMNLMEGIDLPESLKSMLFDMVKENPHIRRTAVLLPLVAQSLTGKKFNWDNPIVLDDETPEGLAEFLNTTRERLIKSPLRLEMGFLNKLSGFIEVWDHETYEEESHAREEELGNVEGDEFEEKSAEPDEEGPIRVAPGAGAVKSKTGRGAGLKEILNESLGHDSIDLDSEVEKRTFPGPPAKSVDQLKEPDNREETGEIDEIEREPDGYTLNPIAAEVQRKAKKKIVRKKPKAKPKPEPVLLPKDDSVLAVKERGGMGIGWLLVIVAGLIVGGGFGYYMHGQAKYAGIYEMEEVEFPLTQYDIISPRVNPFTNTIPPIDQKVSFPPIKIGEGVSSIDAAIAKSKEAIAARNFVDAVDYALWAIQLQPDSLDAGAQLETAVVEWIDSGIDAPSKTADPAAAAVLAEYYITDLDNKIAEALYILVSSSVRGNAEAMRILGLLFGQGKLVPRSPSIAERWLRGAAEKGDHDAQFYYGESSVFGTMIPQNEEGYTFIERASDAGHPRSLLFRGFCCIEGMVVPKDEKSGYRYVARAAEKGSLEALFQMGLCRANGVGTERSDKASAGAFKTAADLGYIPAMYRYAECLLVGFGTPRSYSDGVSWMRKAAAAGHFDAQNWCSQHEMEFEPVAVGQ